MKRRPQKKNFQQKSRPPANGRASRGGDYPDLVYGKNPVLEAIKGPRKVHEVLFSEPAASWKDDELFKQAKKSGVSARYVNKTELDFLSHQAVHQGVVARVQNYPEFALHQLCLLYTSDAADES